MPGGHVRIFKKKAIINEIEQLGFLLKKHERFHSIHSILEMIHNVEEKAPLQRTVTQEEVGSTAAFLASPLASGITGQVLYVDAGYCITGM